MTTEIEKTRRALYDALAKIRKAKKHPKMTDALESALEAYLEEYHKFEYPDLQRRLATMTEERDQIQGRLHAIDHAYCEQSNLVTKQAVDIEALQRHVTIAGEELIRVQVIARQHLDDCRSAEKLSDDLSEKLAHATSVIGQQEQLIAGQRLAIAELFGLKNRKTQAVKCAHEFHPSFPGGARCVYCMTPSC
jgi:hypothetical protein